jgi:hypothetical protein
MDDEALQKQSNPISLADVVWKIREAVDLTYFPYFPSQ